MSFLLTVGQTFAELGREVEVDSEARALAVESELADGARLLVIVRPVTQGLTIYAVHPTRVPEDKLLDVAEFVARANGNEFTVAFELDFTNRTVSARAGLELADVELSQLDAEAMLAVLVAELESVARAYGPVIDGVVEGELSPEQAANAGRSARFDERLAVLDDVEADAGQDA